MKTLINKCKEKGLLDEEHYRLAEDIRNIRNCYVHFENMMAYFNQMQRNLENKEGILKTYETEEERKIVEIILNSQLTETITLPDTTWCANTDTVRFLETRHASFSRWLVKMWAETFKKDLETKKIKRAYQGVEELLLTTADASYCLNKTAEILAYIGILPEEEKDTHEKTTS